MSEREERRFVEIPRESVRLMAESTGLELSDEVAALLAEDVCYRLREATQLSIHETHQTAEADRRGFQQGSPMEQRGGESSTGCPGLSRHGPPPCPAWDWHHRERHEDQRRTQGKLMATTG
uniref:TATA box binding protein associated factor (TAF) histone-like fold domain-containing protein n=1 Tax=Ursus maritimus TaxID=29073 RepID=A0A452UGH4_URSMA